MLVHDLPFGAVAHAVLDDLGFGHGADLLEEFLELPSTEAGGKLLYKHSAAITLVLGQLGRLRAMTVTRGVTSLTSMAVTVVISAAIATIIAIAVSAVVAAPVVAVAVGGARAVISASAAATTPSVIVTVSITT